MTVTESINARSSIRAFLPKKVDRTLLLEILKLAARTPSWGNTQPWEIFIADGDVLVRIRKAYTENYEKNIQQAPEIPRPASWPDEARRRQQGINAGMTPEVQKAFSQFGMLNQTIFYAPTVVYLCMDKELTNWAMYDIGAYSMSVMLLAVERGLSTIPSITSVAFPDILHKELRIPDNYFVVIGIPIGYVDDTNDINRLQTLRDNTHNVVRFVD